MLHALQYSFSYPTMCPLRMAHTFSLGSPPASNVKKTLSSLAFYPRTKYEVVTATKVIGEHSHPHSAGWEGSLIGEMKNGNAFVHGPVIRLDQKRCTEVAATPTESSPVKREWRAGFT